MFVSDLGRAIETAEIAFARTDIPVFEDFRLRECNYGDLNGMAVARLRTERALHLDEPFPGGQSYRQVVEQMRGFLRDLVVGWEGRKVLLIAHSANKWALDCLLKGAALEDLVNAEFIWREGWAYSLPTGWAGD